MGQLLVRDLPLSQQESYINAYRIEFRVLRDRWPSAIRLRMLEDLSFIQLKNDIKEMQNRRQI